MAAAGSSEGRTYTIRPVGWLVGYLNARVGALSESASFLRRAQDRIALDELDVAVHHEWQVA